MDHLAGDVELHLGIGSPGDLVGGALAASPLLDPLDETRGDSAGDPVRARMLGALAPGEAETLVGLLTRVAEALNGESVPVGGSK